MAFIYTQSDLKARVNANIHGKIGMVSDFQATLNSAVREAFSKIDFRSARRSAALSPNLFGGVYDYGCPSDLEAYKIIDIPAQAKRQDGQFWLVTSEEFERRKALGSIAIDDANNVRTLRIASQSNSKLLVASELDALGSGASANWSAFGDAENLEADRDDFLYGAGSIKWGINSSGGTTAGIQNSSLNQIDLTDYLGGNGALFVSHKINSATNITNYILRIGTDSSNYYQKTITTRHDGTAFVSGWNLLRFDLTSLSETGSVTDSNIRYIAIYMTKSSGKISETDYKFDYIALMRGEKANVKYYTKYGWQTSAGAYQENSSATTDLLVADADEFELLILKASENAAREVKDNETANKYEEKWKSDSMAYQLRNPSEAKVMTSSYYDY